MSARAAPAIPRRDVTADAAWQAVYDAACAPYRRAGRFAWHWARGKLARDPVFRGLLERGDLTRGPCVLDIGCGQGLVASLLNAAQQVAARGLWPAVWPAPPQARAYTGIELARRDIARARAALAAVSLAPLAAQFVRGDLRHTPLPPCDVVVILDVLHYVGHEDQLAVLARVQQALTAAGGRGRLLLRVGDAADAHAYARSLRVDRVVAALRQRPLPPAAGRPLAEWVALLRELRFTVESAPMNQGTPYANVLLVADADTSAPHATDASASASTPVAAQRETQAG